MLFFLLGKNGLAYLTCGPQLEVVNSLTGERLSAYRFSGVSDESPIILAVKEFSWQKRTGLLIGLEDAEGSVLCLYDLGISRVVKAVVLPGRVTAIEPIINHGGASASTQHLHPSLRWLFGVAAVVTNVGQVLLIDLCLDDLSCSQNELEASGKLVILCLKPKIEHLNILIGIDFFFKSKKISYRNFLMYISCIFLLLFGPIVLMFWALDTFCMLVFYC